MSQMDLVRRLQALVANAQRVTLDSSLLRELDMLERTLETTADEMTLQFMRERPSRRGMR